MKLAPSTAPVVLKAQHEPQMPCEKKEDGEEERYQRRGGNGGGRGWNWERPAS
ncbi:unnamed protein product [Spirodela intermedia]|uniref:Uncharacterized protein n=1 Tax=Spirodela intermedia TaxID=51605 RepID=A0A7I8K229_SPIIN|nr:unnamed protein product [Spirodela intermedia]